MLKYKHHDDKEVRIDFKNDFKLGLVGILIPGDAIKVMILMQRKLAKKRLKSG